MVQSTTSGSARGVRSNAHSYRNWGEGLGDDPSYPAFQGANHDPTRLRSV